MITHPTRAAEPAPQELQPLFGAMQAQQWTRAVGLGQALLQRYPKSVLLLSVVGSALAEAGQLQEAEQLMRRASELQSTSPDLLANLGLVLQRQARHTDALAVFARAARMAPQRADFHFNLANAQAALGQYQDAEASFRLSLRCDPRLVDAHFNLGVMFQARKQSADAEREYRAALQLQPRYVEALANLGAVLQAQGRLAEAIDLYQQGLAIRQDALAYFNLGTAYRDAGRLDAAVAQYQRALEFHPRYAEAWNNLGEIERDQGQFIQALQHFEQAIACGAGFGLPHYNIGVFLSDAGRHAEAIPHFEASRYLDWEERVLVCLYKTRRFDDFRARLADFKARNPRAPMVANLSAHHAANFGMVDDYPFCPDPLGHVYQVSLAALVGPESELRSALLADITQAQIDERAQGRLHHGVQSAGNLFKRPEASFAQLAVLIKQAIQDYRQHYAVSDCLYIRDFPTDIEFNSSWYVRMRQGGHLTSHIHEEGWLSGCVYLSLPTRLGDATDGCIEFSLDGDDYPRQQDTFPTRVYRQAVGDLVLFPSSLFHRTIPFSADEERTCIAFDIRPPSR